MMARSNRIQRISHLTRPARRRTQRPQAVRGVAERTRSGNLRRVEPLRAPAPPAARPPQRFARRIRLVVWNRAPRKQRHVPVPKLTLVPRRPPPRRREITHASSRPERYRHALGTLVAAVALAAAGLAAIATSIGRLFVDGM